MFFALIHFRKSTFKLKNLEIFAFPKMSPISYIGNKNLIMLG